MYKILRNTGYVGLFGLVKIVIDNLDRLKHTNIKLFVDFSGITLYYDPSYKETDNVWEYYFEQPYKDLSKEDIFNNGQYGIIDNNDGFRLGFTKNRFMDYDQDLLKSVQETSKMIIVKKHIQDKIDRFYNDNLAGYSILGVQKRGTDEYRSGHGYMQYNLMDFEYYKSQIKDYIDKYDKLFLITDEKSTIDDFKKYYGSRVVHYDEAVLSDDIELSHIKNSYIHGEGAVIDTMLLSKSNFLLAVCSNLSTSAIIFNDKLEYKFIDKHISYHC